MRIAHVSLSLALACLPAAAGTWIIDDDGPADFTTIQAAIDAAAPGDTLLVQSGVYAVFVLDKPLAIVGFSGASVATGAGNSKILGLPAGTTAVISGLSFGIQGQSLVVQDCQGTVVLDGLAFVDGGLGVSGSSDTRLRASTLATGLYLDSSRVEASECVIKGSTGNPWGCPYAGNGFTAVNVGAGGRAHLYRSQVTGGTGGKPYDVFNCNGGDGGTGIVVTGGDMLLAGDPTHFVHGGKGGSGMSNGLDGYPMYMYSGAHARISGIPTPSLGAPSGTVEIPIPRDPTLFILEQVGAGETVTLRVQTEPGATVELLLGRMPAVGAQVGSAEVLLLVPLRTFQLGPAAGNGVASLNFTTPGYLPMGFTYYAQGRVTFPGGEQRYTNSVPLIVR